MHGFPHQFPTIQENATKPMVWEKSGKLILIFFPLFGCFFPHQISILLHTPSDRKYMGFPFNFRQYGKMLQNPLYEVNLGNQYSYFPHSMSASSHPIPCMRLHQFSIPRENAKKPIVRKHHGEKLGNWYSYFSHNMVTFFSLESHPKVNFITWGVHVFSHHFPTNLINVESMRLEVGQLEKGPGKSDVKYK